MKYINIFAAGTISLTALLMGTASAASDNSSTADNNTGNDPSYTQQAFSATKDAGKTVATKAKHLYAATCTDKDPSDTNCFYGKTYITVTTKKGVTYLSGCVANKHDLEVAKKMAAGDDNKTDNTSTSKTKVNAKALRIDPNDPNCSNK
jgi:osmotically-inducible protein OsmY